MMMSIGWTTTADRESAEKLALGSIDGKLAACAEVEGPIRSFYRWKGNLENAEEYRITFKFISEKSGELESWLRANHPYEVPQWLTVPAEHVLAEYWQWARESQGGEDARGPALEAAIELSKKGNKLLRSGSFQEAEEVLLEAVELDPGNAYILVGLGDLYRETRKFNRAISYYERILVIDEENVFALRGIGDAYRGLNQHEKAIHYWQRYLACNQDDIQVMTRVGDSYKKLRNLSESERFYRQALTLEPNDRYALLGIGSLFYKAEKDDEGLQFLERLLNLDDRYVAVLTMVGNIYRRRQDFEQAIVYYQKAVDYEPENTFALYGLGDCYRWLRNYAEVVRWWSYILEKEPRNQVMHSRVGDAFFNMGDHAKALEHYQASLKIRFDPYAHLGMSRIYRKEGQLAAAEECCLRILDQAPEHLRGLEELAEVYRETGNSAGLAEVTVSLAKLAAK
ncbi:MAG TPA: divalent cation tolerance protein CutA [Desulfurivibrionaceae bacterium]|nr:divalent cation tolerance protein CutA [Desulfurivibrionaceae bacterium]